ncbi:MAG: hypothetical protein WA418_12735 [Bradyrhizobium sp.]
MSEFEKQELPGATAGSIGDLDASLRDELERAHAQHSPIISDSRSDTEAKPAGAIHSGVDGAVLAVSELLFLLFGLPFGDDLYHDHPIPLLHWVYLGVAIACAVAGPMWPTVRNRWASPVVAASIATAARDARIWIALLLMFLLYGVAPDIYRRARVPDIASACWDGKMPPCNDEQADAVPNKKLARALQDSREQGVIVANQLGAALMERDKLRAQIESILRELAQAHSPVATSQPTPPVQKGPIAWNLDSQFLVTSTNGGDNLVNGLIFQGTSTTSVAFKEAYAVSDLTGHRQELMANVPYKGYFSVAKVDVPPQASVQLDLVWTQPLSVRDFVDQWGKLRIAIVYSDGITYEHEFDEAYVRQKIRQQIPGAFSPRVTPKDSK